MFLDAELFAVIRDCPLFQGIAQHDLIRLCAYVNVRVKEVEQHYVLCSYRQPMSDVFYISRGTVSLVLYDAWGHRMLVNLRSQGFLMGGIGIFEPHYQASFNVVAETPCTVLQLDRAAVQSLLSDDHVSDGMAAAVQCFSNNIAAFLAENLTSALSHMGLFAQHTVRERLALYLSDQAVCHGSHTFSIAMNRQQLADYLSIDRSTLCEELSKMRREGLIDYHLNHFELLNAVLDQEQ